MQPLTTQAEFDALAESATVVLLKHGARCPISTRAREEIAAFANAHPNVPVCAIEVTANRTLSEYVADRLGVTHESPQAIVLRDGRAVWYATHYDITVDELVSQLVAR